MSAETPNPWANANFQDITPKDFDLELWPDPVKKGKVNLDERPQRRRRISSKAQSIVMTAVVDGRFLSLNIRQRRILEARYLSENGPASYRELGEEFGVSRERIRQVEHQTLEKLQKFA